MMNCIIIDDEAHAIELLTLHIAQTPFLKLTGSATRTKDALQLLNSAQVDLVFLDIQMPEMTGIEFLQVLNGRYRVILTTAFREYAIEGFEHQVVDYLLKPIFFPRFLIAAQRAFELHQTARDNADDFILVKSGYKGKLVKIKIEDILYIEGKGKYITFYTLEGDPVTSQVNLGNIEEKLSGDRFMRIHKSFIIALPFLVMIHGNTVQLGPSLLQVPIGQTYRERFMLQMKDKVVTNKEKEGTEEPPE
ncbi:LytR/AlgR family response regulator transcription factor [Pedobacter sp. UBA5917]|jgi:DNA-binding LytR/AlgR family response regulator|uniref:LytR/AlgR family response regulator transcription factor n=1 Tax=Pedobacter sp. UBA5917 TaxID=1947061 RepID=UPI002601302E|nr:response regulator transcription factor [Pedobacter sp. UBA5917]